MLYASYTNVRGIKTGAIHVIGLGDERYELIDTAFSHMAALEIASCSCHDFYEVRLVYPGQNAVWTVQQEWDADDEAKDAALAYMDQCAAEGLLRQGVACMTILGSMALRERKAA